MIHLGITLSAAEAHPVVVSLELPYDYWQTADGDQLVTADGDILIFGDGNYGRIACAILPNNKYDVETGE